MSTTYNHDTDRIDRAVREQAKVLLPRLILTVRDYRGDKEPPDGPMYRTLEAGAFRCPLAVSTDPNDGIYEAAIASQTSCALAEMANCAFEVFEPLISVNLMIFLSPRLKQLIDEMVAAEVEEKLSELGSDE